MLQLQTEFNESIIREQSSIASKILFYKSFGKLKGLIIFGTIMTVLGLVAGIEDKEYINPFTVIGLIWITFILIIGFTTFLVFQTVNRRLKVSRDESLRNKFINHYQFFDEGLRYSSKYSKVEIKWAGIHGYSIIKNNIFIMTSELLEFSIIIGKTEISEDEYDSLLIILNNNTKFIEYKNK